MPELPEVETTRLGLTPVLGRTIESIDIRNSALRLPVSPEISDLPGRVVREIRRRGKYLLFGTDGGWFLVHLGMSGSLRLSRLDEPLRKHDHILLALSGSFTLRFHDPRRFGLFLWLGTTPTHPLLDSMGPEPLDDAFSANHLFSLSRTRGIPVKSFIMDNHVVVGVGNIYAAETLFYCGLHPLMPARALTAEDCRMLRVTIRHILAQAIQRGGTTLRDFVNSAGNPGYFQQELMVYGRDGENCRICHAPLQLLRIGGRSSVFCPSCQPVRP